MIWIIGSKGMLGTEFQNLFTSKKIKYYATDKEVDIANFDALEKYSHGKNIKYVINCAAYTAVDNAEDEPDLCYKLNALAPGNIAKLCGDIGSTLIHISTDYVFDGRKQLPYTEDDIVNPLSIYGKSKLEGEQNILSYNKSIILRTAWLYGQHGKNFVFTMLNLMKSKEEIGVVSDQWGAPAWTYDLARCVDTIISADKSAYGIFNASGEGKTNWYEFAKAIQQLSVQKGILNKEIKINPLATEEYPTKAIRPQNSLLNKKKLKTIYGFVFPDWKESLNKFLDTVK